MTYNTISGIAILLLLLFAIYGYNVGLLEMIVRLFSSVVLICISGIGSTYAGNFLIEYTGIEDFVAEKLGETEGLSSLVTGNLSRDIIYCVSFVLLMILATLLLKATRIIVRVVEHIPGIYGINKILGIIPAVALYLAILWTALYIVELCVSMPWANEVLDQVKESEFLLYIEENNYLKIFINMLLTK